MFSTRQHQVRDGVQRAFDRPSKLPHRRRQLTPSPSSEPSKSLFSRAPRPRLQQRQSQLFGKLPRYIRDRIWELSLGQMEIRLSILHRHLRQWHDLPVPVPASPSTPRHLSALPKTCHAVYRETIDLLYALNHFFTADRDCIAFLPTLLRPSRLASIRNFRVVWEAGRLPRMASLDGAVAAKRPKQTAIEEQWELTWQTLAEMRGLEHLRVEIRALSYVAQADWAKAERGVVVYAARITRPKDYTLLLSWEEIRKKDGESLPEKLPFRIERVGLLTV